jgi:tetratricopeptide (TPR) repeat protein
VPLIINLFLFVHSLVAGDPRADSLEKMLPTASGSERLDLLLDIAKEDANANADKTIYYSGLAASLSDSLGNETARAEAFHLMGQGLKLKGEFDQALNYADSSMQLYKNAGERLRYISLINFQGLIHQSNNNLEMANHFYQKAQDEIIDGLKTEPENDTLREYLLTSKNNLGLILILGERYDTAKSYYKSLLEETGENDTANLQVILGNLVYIHNLTGDYDEAIQMAERALEINRSSGDRNLEARSLMSIGNINYYKGDYKQALEYYKSVFEINMEVGNIVTGARCANNIAAVNKKLGSYEEAIRYFQKSLDLKEELNDLEGMASTYGNIGIVYSDWGEYGKALNYYREAMETNRKLGSRAGLAWQYNNIGSAYVNLQRADSARVYYKMAIALSDSINDPGLKVRALAGLADIYYEGEEYDTALRYVSEALERAEKMEWTFWVARCRLIMGKVYLKTGKYARSLNSLKAALEYAEPNEAHEILTEAHLYLSEVYEKQGMASKSLLHFKSYTHVKDSIFNTEKAAIVSELQARYETEKKELENLALKGDNQLKQLKLKNQKRAIYAMSFGISLAVILLSTIIFLYRKRTIAYHSLVKKNLELARCDRETSMAVAPSVNNPGRTAGNYEDKTMDEALVEKFNRYMKEEKPYLYASISLEEVSAKLGTNRTYLSRAINNILNKNFNSIINELRVREARQLLVDEKYDHISVEGIGEMVGYNSRIAFYNNFKKITGLSPSYFKASIS